MKKSLLILRILRLARTQDERRPATLIHLESLWFSFMALMLSMVFL